MPDRTCRAVVFTTLAILLAGLPAAAPVARAQTGAKSRIFPGGSGLAVPRFVSVKSSRVNMRKGPGTDYPTVWVYRRAGMPLEVVKEFEGWRQVRDADGATGWVLQSFLSGRRTALVLPWEIKDGTKPPTVALRTGGRESARPIAMVEAGVVANITSCDGRWCRVSIDRFRGYIEQNKLWGVYKNERIN